MNRLRRLLCFIGAHHWVWSEDQDEPIQCEVCGIIHPYSDIP